MSLITAAAIGFACAVSYRLGRDCGLKLGRRRALDAITCSKNLEWTQDGESFTVTCEGRAKWSGPPSDAEVQDAAERLRAALEALGG